MAGYEMIDKAIDEQLDLSYQHDFPIDAWIPLQHAPLLYSTKWNYKLNKWPKLDR